tara:strand:+ start:25837 stop:26376 length:540 start_codon:yes stop_codon:yes gene_type:complete
LKEIVYHVAVSLDGFIAGPGGDVAGFPHTGPHVQEYLDALGGYDMAIMGRRTYEFGYAYGLKPGANPYPLMETYVFSASLELPGPQQCEIHCIRDDFLAQAKKLKQGSGGPIYLCGGGTFAGTLMENELVDRLILKFCPVSFGAGIPLWRAGKWEPVQWSLLSSKAYENGVLLLEYERK